MDFLCLDVETTNESAANICQIGIATFIVGEGRAEPSPQCSLFF
jgi:hypothetical protein